MKILITSINGPIRLHLEFKDWYPRGYQYLVVDDNYCGAPDSNSFFGMGATAQDAIDSYVEQMA